LVTACVFQSIQQRYDGGNDDQEPLSVRLLQIVV